MPNLEAQLAEITRLIKEFEQLVKNYPNNPPYIEALVKLRQKRAELANTIGR